MYNKDIFDLSISETEKSFVQTALDIEKGITVNLVENLSQFPYVGSLLKLAKVGIAWLDCRFIKKLSLFLQQSENKSIEEKQAFLNSMNCRERKLMNDYMLHVLYTAEDDEKAIILGLIYESRLNNQITNSQLLRLIHVVNRIYVHDLRMLRTHNEGNIDDDIIIDSLISVGLVQDTIGIWVDSPLKRTNGNLKHILNETGICLYNILDKAHWFD